MNCSNDGLVELAVQPILQVAHAPEHPAQSPNAVILERRVGRAIPELTMEDLVNGIGILALAAGVEELGLCRPLVLGRESDSWFPKACSMSRHRRCQSSTPAGSIHCPSRRRGSRSPTRRTVGTASLPVQPLVLLAQFLDALGHVLVTRASWGLTQVVLDVVECRWTMLMFQPGSHLRAVRHVVELREGPLAEDGEVAPGCRNPQSRFPMGSAGC